jgi:hypothetical protein
VNRAMTDIFAPGNTNIPEPAGKFRSKNGSFGLAFQPVALSRNSSALVLQSLHGAVQMQHLRNVFRYYLREVHKGRLSEPFLHARDELGTALATPSVRLVLMWREAGGRVRSFALCDAIKLVSKEIPGAGTSSR